MKNIIKMTFAEWTVLATWIILTSVGWTLFGMGWSDADAENHFRNVGMPILLVFSSLAFFGATLMKLLRALALDTE